MIEIGGAFYYCCHLFFGIKAFFKISTFYHAIFLKSKATFFKVKIKGFPLALFKIKIKINLKKAQGTSSHPPLLNQGKKLKSTPTYTPTHTHTLLLCNFLIEIIYIYLYYRVCKRVERSVSGSVFICLILQVSEICEGEWSGGD